MTTLLQPHQDFFLYVSTASDKPACPPNRIEGATYPHPIGALPACSDSWIKISLADSLVVYAYLLGKQDEIVSQN